MKKSTLSIIIPFYILKHNVSNENAIAGQIKKEPKSLIDRKEKRFPSSLS